MDVLDKQQIQSLQDQLLRLRTELNEQLEISEQAAGVVTLDQTAVGRVSRMDAMQQQSMAKSTREKASSKLKKVQAALQAISDNDYGYCRKCDELIAFKRLQAQPEAQLCIHCQDKVDRQQ